MTYSSASRIEIFSLDPSLRLKREGILKGKKKCRLEIFRKAPLFFDGLLISLAPGHKQLAQGNCSTEVAAIKL